MSGGRCEKHDNWHAECRPCLEDAAYARGVADERARVVAWLRGDAGPFVAREAYATLMNYAASIERGEHEREAT